MLRRFAMALGVVVGLSGGAAQAGPLTGVTVTGSHFPFASSVAIGPGAEYDLLGMFFVDFDENGLISYYRTQGGQLSIGFEGNTFSFSGGSMPDITGVSLTTVTGTVDGLAPGDLSYTANSVTIDLFNTNWHQDSAALVTIQFNVPAPQGPTPTPEPGSLAVGAVALAGLALRRRRGRAAQ